MAELASYCNGADFCHYFSHADPESFSAVTIFLRKYRRIIVHNESHHLNRQASNISHELSHTLLEHAPTAITSSDGRRFWNSEMEEEATWLGAALLVPRDGALKLLRNGATTAEIAAQYGVSEALCSWRIANTGISQQLERTKRWYE